MSAGRQLHLSLNMPHPSGGWHQGAWHGDGAGDEVEGYRRAARTAERGLFDAVFLADVPRLRDQIATEPVQTIEPTILLATLAAATERIGLVGTASTTFNEPYNIARRFQSLDLVSGGRAAWNAVTTWDPVTGANFGVEGQLPRETRYARAEEFVDVVRALWRSWDPGAIVADTASGRYTDPDGIRPIDHRGPHFAVRGPITLPPSPQVVPLLFQAGGSPRGRALAARTADAIFSAVGTLPSALADAADVRTRARAVGRPEEEIRILPGLRTFLGSTDEEARRRVRERRGPGGEELLRLAQALLVPPEALDPDRPVPVELLAGPEPTDLPFPIGFHRAVRARAREGHTVGELLDTGGGNGHLQVVGSPERVADLIEEWFLAGAADGFNIMPDTVDPGFTDFVDHVVPLLQRRGLFRREYTATTLRGHYGLPLPTRELVASGQEGRS